MKKILCLTSLLALCGCANVAVVKPEAGSLAAYRSANLAVVTYKKPAFLAVTWGAAGLGPGGVAAMIGAGANITGNHHVPDPALAIADKVSARVAEELKPASSQTIASPKEGPLSLPDISTLAGNKGLVLDVATLGWSFNYFSLDWSHYHVMYAGIGRLTDAATGKLVAQVPCKYDTEDEKDPPSYDDLVANDAAILKTKLAAASDSCTDTIVKGLLGP